MHKTNFELISEMNEAFGNPKGDPTQINRDRIRSQCKNILHEYTELLKALGANPESIEQLLETNKNIVFNPDHFDLKQVRDALCDVRVFSLGAHHLMGIDANRDMRSVHKGIMTRFIKDEADKQATIAKHAASGVTEVYFEGDYPTMVMKSAKEQPDAPAGKFMKSASFSEPVFYSVDV